MLKPTECGRSLIVAFQVARALASSPARSGFLHLILRIVGLLRYQSGMWRVAALLLYSGGIALGDPSSWIAQTTADLKLAASESGTEALLVALDRTWTELVAKRGRSGSREEVTALIAVLQEIERRPGAEHRAKLWRVAAAACHPGGVALLARGLASHNSAAALADAVRESRSVTALTWLWKYSSDLRRQGKAGHAALGAALTAGAAALAAKDLNDTSTSIVGTLRKTVRETLRDAKGAEVDMLLIALAQAPNRPARAEILAWLKKRGSVAAERRLQLIAALGKAGDPAAVPVLLAQLEDTPAPVLEATLIALFNLPESTRKATGKSILRATKAAIEAEGKGKRQRTYDPERHKAWWTFKIIDRPPTPLPAGAGTTGLHALWWRVIDSAPAGVRPPRASRKGQPRILNGRPNLTPDEWNSWHRRVR